MHSRIGGRGAWPLISFYTAASCGSSPIFTALIVTPVYPLSCGGRRQD